MCIRDRYKCSHVTTPNNNITCDQNNLTKMPHRRRTWTVQWSLPDSARCAPYILPWAHPSPQPKRHLDRFSHFCTTRSRESQRAVAFPITRGSERHLIYASLGPPKSTKQMASRSVRPFLQWAASTYVVLRCGLKIHRHNIKRNLSKYTTSQKVKSTVPHEECWWDAHLPYLGLEHIGGCLNQLSL